MRFIFAAALMGAVLAGTTAQAALWTIENGGTTPSFADPLAIPNNDTMGDIGVQAGDGVLSAGRIRLTGPSQNVSLRYLGSESGFTITATMPGGASAETNRDPATTIATALASPADIVSTGLPEGLLDLVFTRDGGTPIIGNAGNPGNDGSPSILYGYLRKVINDPTVTSRVLSSQTLLPLVLGGDVYEVTKDATDLILFALDDGGAARDGDFDDFVGILTVTPVPGAAFMLVPALAGLALVRRRAARA